MHAGYTGPGSVSPPCNRLPRTTVRMKTKLLTVLALLVVLSACAQPAGPGVARGNPSASATASSSASGNRDPVGFAKCMRANGVPKFPDPDKDGGISIGSDMGFDPNSTTFKNAQKACQKFMPPPSAAEQAEAYKNGLKYAKCMRDNGVKNFPDPEKDGGTRIEAGPGSGMDPESPAYQKAEKACQSIMGGPGGHRRVQTGGGK